jgi:GxxExxY protein
MGGIMLHEELSEKIIGAFFNVYNALGYGFLEKIYENVMLIELEKVGLFAEAQKNIKVYYESKEIGNYFADILVDNRIIIELKAESNLCKEHEAQLTNYLRATEIEVGLLLNFGKTAQFKRKIFENRLKTNLNC